MKNIEEVVFNPELGIDADLEGLLAKDGANLLSLQVIGHWRRGFTEEEIGEYFDTNPKEVESMVSLVQGLVPPERLALDQKNRDEILKIKSESIELNEKFKKSLAKSPEAHMQEGRNPASVLKQFRESIAAGEPSVISGLREESNIEIIEKIYENSLAEEDQIIAELRRADQKPSEKIVNVTCEPAHGTPGRNMQTAALRPSPKPQSDHTDMGIMTATHHANPISQPTQNSNKIPIVKKPDRRVTLRLNKDVHEKLHKYSEELNVDISTIMRSAITQYLDNNSNALDVINDAMPSEAFQHTGPFRAWGKGDLRVELKKRFEEMLALAFVTQKHYPKTKGMRDVYLELLPICRNLGIGEDRQTKNG